MRGLFVIIIIGLVLYAIGCFQQAYYHRLPGINIPVLPEKFHNQQLLLRGQINTFVKVDNQVRFEFKVQDHPRYQGKIFSVLAEFNPKSQLQLPKLGELWQLQLRLRRPRGFRTKGVAHHGWSMAAKGRYGVAIGDLSCLQCKRLAPSDRWSAFRLAIAHRMTSLGGASSADYAIGAALGRALVLGDKSQLSSEVYTSVQTFGLAHVLAVSGTHIGIMAWLGLCLGAGMWRLFGATGRKGHTLSWQLTVSLLCAVLYGCLSGMALPAQRALLTLIPGTLYYWATGVRLWHHWFWLSFALVLCWSPLAPMAMDFWCSFGAIGLLILAFDRKKSKQSKKAAFIQAQLLLTFGLLPAVIIMSGELSWLSPVLNLVVIPLLAWLILPGLFIGLALSAYGWDWLTQLLLWLLTCGFESVQWLGQQPIAQPSALAFTFWFGSCLVVMVLTMSVPAFRCLRLSSGVLLLLLGVMTLNRPMPGYFWLDVLDVGQGTSVLVRTQHHGLLYDTGPKWQSGRDAAQVVVLPFLRQQGLKTLAMVLISHEDQDHIGGAASVLSKTKPLMLMSSTTIAEFADVAVTPILFQNCKGLQRWWWDGVLFTSLGLTDFTSPNNRSCVLLIDDGLQKVVIAGDIEFAAEQQLLQEYPSLFAGKSAIVVAPHHGSLTSSSTGFIAAVNPAQVVFTTSSPSRFNHPHPQVLARYQIRGICAYNTGSEGSLHWRSDQQQKPACGLKSSKK